MSAESWERRKAELAIPLLQFTVGHYLHDAQVTDTIRRLILSEPTQDKDEANVASVLRDLLNEGITVSHHYATVLNLARRRAGKTWLNPVPETSDLTLSALACISQGIAQGPGPKGGKIPDTPTSFLSSALTLFEILNSVDVDINEDDVNGLLARLWRADHVIALAVYRRTSFRETYHEAATELLDAGARPLKVLGLIADALQTQHMEGMRATASAGTFAVPEVKHRKKSRAAKSVIGSGGDVGKLEGTGKTEVGKTSMPEQDESVVGDIGVGQQTEDGADDLRSEVGSQLGKRRRKKQKTAPVEE